MLQARTPITRVLSDAATPADERERLALVLEAREYARGLGLDVGEQYTSYAPWPGDRLVTAVVATPPGRLEPEPFWFPLVGEVPYKGFFDPAGAEAEADRLRARGLDVCLSAVPAYSTLGWLADPVTGPLLRAPRVDLVATVIHELVHATVYVPGDAALNEGLATFVGEEGAIGFFEARDGPKSASAREARARVADLRAVAAVLSSLRDAVATLYAAEPAGPERAQRRADLQQAARDQLAALPLHTLDAPDLARRLRTNDACLALESTYSADLPRYERRLADLGGDLRALVAAARAASRTPDPRAALLGP